MGLLGNLFGKKPAAARPVQQEPSTQNAGKAGVTPAAVATPAQVTWRPDEVAKLCDRRDYDAAVAAFRRLVEAGVGVDEIRDTSSTGNAPIWVKMLGREDAVRFAVSAGADVNARDNIGQPVLVVAIADGYDEIVELLIDRGADVNPDGDHHDSPLSAAAKKGAGAIVDALLAAGADVNRANEYGHTPLMSAAMSGDVAIMQRLVSSGADANAKDKMGRAATYYAVANQKTAAIEYLTTIAAGSARPERVQAIVSFSRRPMSEWDAGELHREIERTQHEMGHMTDTGVFKKENVVAGDSIDDQQYIYAHLRESLSDLGGHELMSRCYVHDFQASDGNGGKYVVVLDRPKGDTPADIPTP